MKAEGEESEKKRQKKQKRKKERKAKESKRQVWLAEAGWLRSVWALVRCPKQVGLELKDWFGLVYHKHLPVICINFFLFIKIFHAFNKQKHISSSSTIFYSTHKPKLISPINKPVPNQQLSFFSPLSPHAFEAKLSSILEKGLTNLYTQFN